MVEKQNDHELIEEAVAEDERHVEKAETDSETSVEEETSQQNSDAVGGDTEKEVDRHDEEVTDTGDTTDAPVSDDAVPAQEVSDEPVESAQQSGEQVEYDDTFVTLTPGEVVSGKVVQVSADEVMVDVGYKSEGRIPLNEIGLKHGESPEDILQVGDEIDVHVLKVEDAEGNVLLSKRRADHRVAWERLERAEKEGEAIEAEVTERVKGGLLADVGVRGFIPASHVSLNYVENLDEYVGKTLRLKVIEIDKQKNNVVLSHKEVLEEEYNEAKVETFETLEVGGVVEGVVKRITDFGAFVDIGSGVEGLLHVSEMAWSRVAHPSDVVSEGQTFDVKVLKIDPEKERISLSLKATLPDPWDTVDQRYQVGSIVAGTVTRVVDFGAFVKLEDGVEGLVHVSQLADYHVENPNEVVKSGDEVDVRVVSVDQEKRRIGLSMRDPEAPRTSERSRPRAPQKEEPRTSSGDAPAVTLGDMFGDLSSFFDNNSDD